MDTPIMHAPTNTGIVITVVRLDILRPHSRIRSRILAIALPTRRLRFRIERQLLSRPCDNHVGITNAGEITDIRDNRNTPRAVHSSSRIWSRPFVRSAANW